MGIYHNHSNINSATRICRRGNNTISWCSGGNSNNRNGLPSNGGDMLELSPLSSCRDIERLGDIFQSVHFKQEESRLELTPSLPRFPCR